LVGHFDITAETFGCVCRWTAPDDDPQQQYMLSNNHALANVNRAKLRDAIFRPGPLDGGTGKETVAKLHRFVSIKLRGHAQQAYRVDAAIAAIGPKIACEPSL
jgi:hypothetical protein